MITTKFVRDRRSGRCPRAGRRRPAGGRRARLPPRRRACRDRGCACPDSASSSALVAGRHRQRLGGRVPARRAWRAARPGACASAWREQDVGAEGGLDARTSSPARRPSSVPANTCCVFAAWSEPGGNASRPSSSRNGWVLSQMPCSAISWAVASSIRWPCSMHFTPAAIARWIAAGRVGVHRDIGAPVLGGLDGGAQLRLGEGRDVERAVRRGDAAAGRQLDLRGAQHELLADAQPHLVGAVGDHAAADLPPCASAGRRACAAARRAGGSRRGRW